MKARTIPLVFAILAFWPVLKWYALRVLDRSDEPLGILSLVTALGFMWFSQSSNRADVAKDGSRFYWLLPVLLVGLYAVIYKEAPNLVLAIIMVFTFWSIVRYSMGAWLSKSPPAILGLLLLALPVMSSVDFFFGYPLRLIVAFLVTNILQLYGFSTGLVGSSIMLNGHQVDIDGPCAGVHFLWFSAYLSLFLSCVRRDSLTGTVLSLAIAAVAAVIGNVFRSLSLSLLCGIGLTSIVDYPPIHQGIGAFAFLIVCGLIFLAFKLRLRTVPSVQSVSPESVVPPRTVNVAWGRTLQISYCVVCVIAALMPFMPGSANPHDVAVQVDPRIAGLDLHKLVEVPLASREKEFQTHFPGTITKYSDGKSEFILKNVYAPTRQLHPVSDCLRGSGYDIELRSIETDKDGIAWTTMLARKDRETLMVKERILDSRGSSWTGVSDWYWAASLNRTRGPWLSITKVDRVSPANQQEQL
jgi:exosortase/archaeosortase family protein